MKKQYTINFDEIQAGDVVLEIRFDSLKVERENTDTHKPGTMLVLEDGSYAFKVKDGYEDRPGQEWRILFDDGSTGMFDWDYVQLMEVKESEPAVAVKPAITRDHFINTINSVVDNNGLYVGPDFAVAVTYTADRLGLR